jgi:hypothetical protein
MTTLYKLTDKDATTHGGMRWSVAVVTLIVLSSLCRPSEAGPCVLVVARS